MSTIATLQRVESADHRFSDLDDLVLRLKGLVLARRYRERTGADSDELELYDDEIESVRDQLAKFVSARAA
jgi:hypothetical protein